MDTRRNPDALVMAFGPRSMYVADVMSPQGRWTFVTNHALVLIEVWQQPDITVRAIAERIGITERATHRILAALARDGYLSRKRVGRNNYYFVERDTRFRHPHLAHLQISLLLEAVGRRSK